MTRQELMQAIDQAFEDYVDGKMSLERLRSEIRMQTTILLDEIQEITQQMSTSLNRIG